MQVTTGRPAQAPTLERLRNGPGVSCQAYAGERMRHPEAEKQLGVSEKFSGAVSDGGFMSRLQVLSDSQWSLIKPMLPRLTGRGGRPLADARLMVKGIIYR